MSDPRALDAAVEAARAPDDISTAIARAVWHNENAYRCFMRTEMDVLVLNDFVLYKEDQGVLEEDTSWQEEFQLD